MAYEIKIVEGHDPSSYFWFRPVSIRKKRKILWENVKELSDEFSIEEDYVYRFLYYFFCKHFDKDLFFNKYRYEDGYITNFDGCLTHNIYTYEAMSDMLTDIERTAMLLANDFSNEALDTVKKNFSNYYMCDPDLVDIENHIDVLIDFYHRFVARVKKMMADNPQTNLLSVMGP